MPTDETPFTNWTGLRRLVEHLNGMYPVDTPCQYQRCYGDGGRWFPGVIRSQFFRHRDGVWVAVGGLRGRSTTVPAELVRVLPAIAAEGKAS